ncbi:MAG: hypothetical protein AB7U82_30315 [Blastocatellales bacterium]
MNRMAREAAVPASERAAILTMMSAARAAFGDAFPHRKLRRHAAVATVAATARHMLLIREMQAPLVKLAAVLGVPLIWVFDRMDEYEAIYRDAPTLCADAYRDFWRLWTKIRADNPFALLRALAARMDELTEKERLQ